MTMFEVLNGCWRSRSAYRAWVWAGDEDDGRESVEPPDPVFDHGSIVLGTDGCGMFWHEVDLL